LYKKVQDIIWQEQPWIPLLTEKLVSARSQKLQHFNVMPDTLFDFEQAELN
jgi:glutathione transport system substrate-binding protein